MASDEFMIIRGTQKNKFNIKSGYILNGIIEW